MYRQYSSRNHRNKGIKVKHALQIFGLLAVCFWLIYQVKHSHASDPLEGEDSGALIKIGRKDIRPLYQEIVTANQQQRDHAAEEDENTEVENNPEERLLDKKVEDDETDEHEIEKSDAEADPEEDSISDDGNGRKQENSAEDGGHDGVDESNHEAREELYKADDVSSAVTHDNHMQTTENENKFVNLSYHLHEKILELENNENHGVDANSGEVKGRLEVDTGENSEDSNRSSATDLATNVTTSETKENILKSSKESYRNNILAEASNDILAASNGTTEVTKQNLLLSDQNVTETAPELDHDRRIITEGASAEGSNFKTVALAQIRKYTLDVGNHLSYTNSTDHSESDFLDFSKPSNDTDSFTDTGSFTVVRITRSEHSLKDGSNSQKNETLLAKSVSKNGTDDVLESALTEDENPKEVHINSTDLSGSANS